MKTPGQKIREARNAKKKSQQWLADKLGVTRNAISLWETDANGISTDNLMRLCTLLDVDVNEFREEHDGSHSATLNRMGEMKVEGEVRAGAWLEVEGDSESDEWIPFSKDPLYQNARQFPLRVIGQSMNKFAAHGTFVIIASWEDIGADVKDGDVVIARRQRGMAYEVTLKRARKTDEGWQLVPESTDPKHQEPIQWESSNEDTETIVIGKVIGKYERV